MPLPVRCTAPAPAMMPAMMPARPPVLEAGWPAPRRVRAFATLRHGAGVSQPPFDSFNLGARCGDDPQAVAANRAELIARLRLPSPPHWLRQVHGTTVVRFDAPVGAAHGRDHRPVAAKAGRAQGALRGEIMRPAMQVASGRAHGALLQEEPRADGAVTSAPGTVLAILTADCLPVVFAADDGGEIAAAHAGWRGLAAGVLEATVAAMRTPPARLLAWLGPAAGPQAYEVGQEVLDAFVAGDAAAADAFAATRPGHWRVDLYALASRRLAAAGVTCVHGGGLCTISDPRRFYSHRRDGRTGRMATLAWIAP